jgi:bacterioferritin (cytochrome b1)
MRERRLNTGFSVSRNRWLLLQYAFIEERLFTTLAGWIWSTPRLEHKVEFGRLAYEDALHSDALRKRAAELSLSTAEAPRQPELHRLELFANEIANTRLPVERFVGVFRVLKTNLLTAYRNHLEETDDVVDGPTAGILRRLIAEEQEHIEWGEDTLQGLMKDPAVAGLADPWELHLQEILQFTGGLTGEGRSGLLPNYYHPQPPSPETDFPARDGRHRLVPLDEYRVSSMGESANEVVRHLLYQNTYGEMEAEDLLGQVLAHGAALPWQMRLDLARQMWDEARHAEMSWRRMEELGGRPDPLPPVPPLILGVVGDATDPLEKLLILQRVIEGRVTERHRYRVIHLSQELGDLQTARLFEYIVADERDHIGNSAWIDRLVGDNPERMAQLHVIEMHAERALEDILNRRVDVTARPR